MNLVNTVISTHLCYNKAIVTTQYLVLDNNEIVTHYFDKYVFYANSIVITKLMFVSNH